MYLFFVVGICKLYIKYIMLMKILKKNCVWMLLVKFNIFKKKYNIRYFNEFLCDKIIKLVNKMIDVFLYDLLIYIEWNLMLYIFWWFKNRKFFIWVRFFFKKK